MIKKGYEMAKEIREQMRGGKGSVELTHILGKDELPGKIRLLAKITLNPGCSIGLHRHEGEKEIFYIIRGQGVIDDNGIRSLVSAGDSVSTGDGESHSVENIGHEPLEMLAVIVLN